MFLNFDILTISPILNWRFLSLISLLELIYVFEFTSKIFILIVLYELLYLLNLSSSLSIYTFLILTSHNYKFLFFQILIKVSAIKDFPSLCVEYTSVAFFSNHDFIDLFQNSLPLSAHFLFALRLKSYKSFWKALVTIILLWYFKGKTRAYLLKISKTHNTK